MSVTALNSRPNDSLELWAVGLLLGNRSLKKFFQVIAGIRPFNASRFQNIPGPNPLLLKFQLVPHEMLLNHAGIVGFNQISMRVKVHDAEPV